MLTTQASGPSFQQPQHLISAVNIQSAGMSPAAQAAGQPASCSKKHQELHQAFRKHVPQRMDPSPIRTPPQIKSATFIGCTGTKDLIRQYCRLTGFWQQLMDKEHVTIIANFHNHLQGHDKAYYICVFTSACRQTRLEYVVKTTE